MENNPGNDRAVRPKFYLQNRSNWCWAAAAKTVGLHYKNQHPCFGFTIECPAPDPEQRAMGFVSPPELTGGVLTRDPEGLCHPCEREDGFYIDAWQRAIVMNAGSRRGEEGDWPGGDAEKMDALRFVVTGDLNTCEIRVASLGQYDSPIPLLEAHPEPLGIQIQNQNWMIGNHLQESGQTHSVVLMPDEKGRVRLFDPWDGFSEVYTPAQLFRSGFLSSLGRGVIKWIQYIE